MTASPVKRQKLTESVTEELLAVIRRSRLRPGERLPGERLLAEQMGVSRASLRDAIARLEVLGHLEARQGDGLYVREPSAANLTQPFQGILSRHPQGVQDLLEFRQMIEPEVAALAALRASDEQIEQLWASLRQQEQTVALGERLAPGDLAFHHLIAQIAGNGVVVLVLETMQHLLQQLREQALRGNKPSATLNEHTAIVQAIAARSPEQARAAMTTHLRQVRDLGNLVPPATPPESP